MLKIAVCDDNPEERQAILDSLKIYLHTHPILSGSVCALSSGQDLLAQAQEQGGFDLYLLDVLMPGLDGIQTGQRLRALGDGGEIIYLSTSGEFAVDSYQVQAFFYLLKPVDQTRLFSVLDGAIDKLNRRRSLGIIVPTPHGARRILLDRLLYVERVGRAMRYFCTDGAVDSLSLRSSFREAVQPLLVHPQFCLCGVSFVINLQHVVGVEGQQALLDSGPPVSLPRTAASAFKLAWGSYWLREDRP